VVTDTEEVIFPEIRSLIVCRNKRPGDSVGVLETASNTETSLLIILGKLVQLSLCGVLVCNCVGEIAETQAFA
jgi:hypothetical protein